MCQKLKPIIKIQDLSKKYNKKIVVDNINLEIPESCFALLGPNGAGKIN
jgi:ABC-type multidrug transport system ATPase subunit